MGFRKGAPCKLWSIVERKEKYTVVNLSTNKKNPDTGKYDLKDWQNGFVRLVGQAHVDAKNFQGGEFIRIGECEVTNNYDKEKKKEYTNYVLYGLEDLSGTSNKTPESSNDFLSVNSADEELPFD